MSRAFKPAKHLAVSLSVTNQGGAAPSPSPARQQTGRAPPRWLTRLRFDFKLLISGLVARRTSTWPMATKSRSISRACSFSSVRAYARPRSSIEGPEWCTSSAICCAIELGFRIVFLAGLLCRLFQPRKVVGGVVCARICRWLAGLFR